MDQTALAQRIQQQVKGIDLRLRLHPYPLLLGKFVQMGQMLFGVMSHNFQQNLNKNGTLFTPLHVIQ
jgi:hypothetical protein